MHSDPFLPAPSLLLPLLRSKMFNYENSPVRARARVRTIIIYWLATAEALSFRGQERRRISAGKR